MAPKIFDHDSQHGLGDSHYVSSSSTNMQSVDNYPPASGRKQIGVYVAGFGAVRVRQLLSPTAPDFSQGPPSLSWNSLWAIDFASDVSTGRHVDMEVSFSRQYLIVTSVWLSLLLGRWHVSDLFTGFEVRSLVYF